MRFLFNIIISLPLLVCMLILSSSPSLAAHSLPCNVSPTQYYNQTKSESEANNLINLINNYRAEFGIPPMIRSRYLYKADLWHVIDMTENSTWYAHSDSAGRNPGQRLDECGYYWYAIGEVAGLNYQSAPDYLDALKGSSGHNTVILNARYNEVGSSVDFHPWGIPWSTLLTWRSATNFDSCIDGSPPQVSFTSPGNNSTVSGSTVLSLNASDDCPAISLQILVDNVSLAGISTAPYQYTLDTTKFSNGTHTIKAIARDVYREQRLDGTWYSHETESSINLNFDSFANPSPAPTVIPSPTPTPVSSPISPPVSNTVVISNISQTTAPDSAIIKWTTNIPSTSRVSYGTTAIFGSSTTEDTNLVTSHQVTLTGLTKQTKYYYKVFSKNSAGLETSSSTQNFRTKNR